jgi:hypothetical protein
MSSSRKKVIVRRFIGDTLPGYLPLSGFVRNLTSGRTIELLDLSGRVVPLLLDDIKYICYVRDFNLNDPTNPERLTRRAFLARPRTEGLWLRLTFRTPANEADQFEGLAPIDAALLDDILDDAGLFLTPPDTRSNTQRIYVPRAAITDLVLLAVITTPSRRKPLPTSSLPSLQEDLFNTPLPPNTRPN